MFLLLDTRKVKLITDKFCSFAKGAHLVNVIQFEPTVERAMYHACGNVLICNTMEVVKFMDPISPFQEYFNFEQIRYTWQGTGRVRRRSSNQNSEAIWCNSSRVR
jgi:hypothetical protein